MTPALSHLEILICTALQQQSLPEKDRNIDHVVCQINEEQERILTTIYDEENLEMYVQIRQHQLVRLIDKMLTRFPLVTLDHTYKNIYRTLAGLLEFLEKDFGAYMDEHGKVPYVYLQNAQFHLSGEIKDLELAFDCQEESDELLRELLTAPFYKLLAGMPDCFYSYYQLVYLKTLMMKLLLTPAEDWLQLLLSYDFNDPLYVSYLKEKMQAEVDEMKALSLKREALLLWQKMLLQAPVCPGWHYNRLHKPLRQQLYNWIAHELSCLDKLDMNDTQFGEQDVWKGFKVYTGFSVAQLGRFIGLLLEEKLILNSNKHELAIFFSHFFSSVEQDHISPGNLRNSFYDKGVDLARSRQLLFEKLMRLLSNDI